ncbi:MAG: 4Fe-4S binding protein [Acidobacteria bacterium]|nr:MAG: 4Fe-4S binding protein [Acidobacteriota bacterium]
MQSPHAFTVLKALRASPKPQKKKLVRRTVPDFSQRWRGYFQIAFLAMNLVLGAQFYLFVRYYESGGNSLPVSRPPGVEGWLPIASLMQLKLFLSTLEIPTIHPAGLFLLLAFMAISLIFRKTFCSWLCPVGTVSEGLWLLGRRVFGKNLALPRWLDIPLRSLKYILLSLFLYAVLSMPVAGIEGFLESPYGLIADVKLLNFFRFLGVTGAVVMAVLVALSVLIKNFWCRYLCPYGALMGLLSKFSPSRIVRSPDACIDCGKCTRACPSLIKVDKLIQVTSTECTGCYECVAVCPAEGALDMRFGKSRILGAKWVAIGLAAIFLGFVGTAMMIGHWETSIASDIYFELIPHAAEFGHP